MSPHLITAWEILHLESIIRLNASHANLAVKNEVTVATVLEIMHSFAQLQTIDQLVVTAMVACSDMMNVVAVSAAAGMQWQAAAAAAAALVRQINQHQMPFHRCCCVNRPVCTNRINNVLIQCTQAVI